MSQLYSHRLYAIKMHHASRLHYDLRLEWNGVLLSWALPLGPSYHAGILREAIEMEHHKKKYITFEGVHRTGPIMLWDRGTWSPHPESADIDRCLLKGILCFTLHGEKLKGNWTLLRAHNITKSRRPIWALTKDADAFAETNACILQEQPNSISGKSMDEIIQQWNTPARSRNQQLNLF